MRRIITANSLSNELSNPNLFNEYRTDDGDGRLKYRPSLEELKSMAAEAQKALDNSYCWSDDDYIVTRDDIMDDYLNHWFRQKEAEKSAFKSD